MLSRAEAILGSEKLRKLANSHILIAGLGGVGGHCLETLARMGVRKFTVVDCDRFEASNMNRQLLCTQKTLGMLKTDAAVLRLRELDDSIEVKAFSVFIDSSNADALLDGVDLVADAIDSIDSKCLLISRCIEKKIKIVSSMGAALRSDPTKVRTGDISDVYGCPLAKQVRKKLKDYGITEGVPCVFSPEKTLPVTDGILGSLPSVTGTFGLVLAQLAADILKV